MANQHRILKAMYALVQAHETKTSLPLDAAAISAKTPGLSLGEIEQEMRDLELKKLVQIDRSDNLTMFCRLTQAGVAEAERAANH